MKKVYVNAQWQGGADLVPYDGALELADLYLGVQNYNRLPVSVDEVAAAKLVNSIIGFEILRSQMLSAYNIISADAPDRIFTLGGGCDADVPSIVYLNERYQGNLAILWLDAHGDLNSPSESASSLFYGMPLRSLTNPNCFGLLENKVTVDASRIFHIGGRDFDPAEEAFAVSSAMRIFTVQDIRNAIDSVSCVVIPDHVYIHLDLDVFDPSVFPHTPLPVADGLFEEEVFGILEAMKSKLVGFGIYEYAASGHNPLIEKLVRFGLAI